MNIDHKYACSAHNRPNYLAGGVWCCEKVYKRLNTNYIVLDFPIYYIEEGDDFAFVSYEIYKEYKSGFSVFEKDKLFYVCDMCFLLSNALTKALWPIQKSKLIIKALSTASDSAFDMRRLFNYLTIKTVKNTADALILKAKDFDLQYYYKNSFTIYKHVDGFSYFIPYKDFRIHGIVLMKDGENVSRKLYFENGRRILLQTYQNNIVVSEEFLDLANCYFDYEDGSPIVTVSNNENDSVVLIENQVKYIESKGLTHCIKYENGIITQTYDFEDKYNNNHFTIAKSQLIDANSELIVEISWDENRNYTCRDKNGNSVNCALYFDIDNFDNLFDHDSICSGEL